MKTLFGMTYAQLQNFSTEELNEHMAVFATNQVRENVFATFSDTEGKAEKFLAVYMKHLLKLFNDKFDDQLYADQRSLYDTEERFNKAADMAVRMGNITQLVGGLMNDVYAELMASE